MRTPLGLAVGEDGVGVSDITSAYDAEGNTAVTVALTDGSTHSFTVQKGEGATYETATQSADGLMSAADKAKLDNIEAGAETNAIDGIQVNGTALSILQKIVNLLIVSGASDGAISVNGADVAVTGLAALAYKAEVAYADLAAALKAVIDGHTADLSTLIGSDTGKSVRTIANEELAAQLIPQNAQEALDTLQEISAWIQSHPGEVADINRKLTLGTRNGTEYTTVKAYVEAMVSGLITLSALSANVTGAGNAITGVAYDNTTGAFSFTKGQTFLTEHQDISGKVDKVSGKDLSTNDYTDADKAKVAAALTQHQDISGKVDKVSGKGLSTNDYTTAEKTKLANIAAEANKTIIDTTLSNAGQAADAKTTGDSLSVLRNLIGRMDISCIASGNPATFSDAKAANVKALSVTITPTQSGSGDPYPPGGGKNLFPFGDVSFVERSGSLEFPVSFPAGTYTLTADLTTTDTDSDVCLALFSGGADKYVYLTPGMRSSKTFTASAPFTRVELLASENFGKGAGDSATWANVQLETGSISTDFAPYSNIRPISGVSSVLVTRTGENGANAQTVTVQLSDGSNPLTVYGGTLDVTTGKLTVTHKKVNISDGGWSIRNVNSKNVFTAFSSVTENALGDGVCSCYMNSPVSVWSMPDKSIVYDSQHWETVKHVVIRDDRFSTVNDFVTAMGDQYFVAPFAPVTYQLTPQQLATLSGYNAVRSDAGSVSVIYKANAVLALQTGGVT